MVDVIWSRRALLRLDLIQGYIAQFDPRAARRISRRLIDADDSLAQFPDRGRPVGSGRRELATIAPYVIRYRAAPDRVLILDKRHGAQRPGE